MMMAMTKEEQRREEARAAAIEQMDARWITLRLIDTRRRRIGAVETVVAVADVDRETNEPYFAPQVVSGDEVFKRVGSRYVARILQSDFNMQFLASHHALGYWEIADEDVRKQVEKLAKKLRRDAVPVSTPAPAAKPNESIDFENLSDEQLEAMLRSAARVKAKRDAERPPEASRKRRRKSRAQQEQEQDESQPETPDGDESGDDEQQEQEQEHAVVVMEE